MCAIFDWKEYSELISSCIDTSQLMYKTAAYRKQFIPDKLYKYSSLNKNKIDNILNETAWFSQKDNLNDPFEFKHYFSDGSQSEFEKLNNNINQFLILSLAKSANNKLLWAHYGDEHRGICIEYSVAKYSSLYPVIYLSKRIDASNESETWFKYFSEDCDYYSAEQLTHKLLPLLCIKGDEWSYEDEVRAIEPGFGKKGTNKVLSEVGLNMTKIICGVRCSAGDLQLVIKLASSINQQRLYNYSRLYGSTSRVIEMMSKNNQILKVSKMELEEDSLSLREVDIDINWYEDL